MAGADGDSPNAVVERTMAMAQRFRDFSPANRVLAVEFAQQTARAFQRSMSPAGESWPDLAPSTVRRRAAKVKGGNRRKNTIARQLGLERGQLTAGARRARASAIARQRLSSVPGGGYVSGRPFTPLIDSGRMRQSIAYVPSKTAIAVQAVAYIKYHVGGSLKVRNRPPKRNPLVIQFSANGAGMELIPAARVRYIAVVVSYISTGQIASGA